MKHNVNAKNAVSNGKILKLHMHVNVTKRLQNNLNFQN